MPQITALEPIKRQKYWYELRLDNSVSFAVNDELIFKYLLKPGKTLSDNEIKLLRNEAEYLSLKKKALDILARKRITEKEIRQKLQTSKPGSNHTDKVLGMLKEHGLVDDYNFAVSLILSSLAGSPRSKRYIRQKLYEKGVPPEIIDRAMADELGDYDEFAAAKKIGEKKYKTVQHLPQLKAKKRVADFLQGRGFNWDVINKVLNNLFTESDGSL